MRWWFLTAISDLYLYIMNNMRFIFLCCVVLNSFLLFGQDDYNELSDSKYVDLEVWRKQKDDLCISWGDANKHYSSQNVPDVPICLKHKLKGWKGEKLNALFLIWSKLRDCNVSVEITDLHQKNGGIISKENLSVGFVRYVMTDEFVREGKTSCGFRYDKTEWDSSLVADVIDIKKDFLLRKMHVTPVWVSINVPRDITAGKYYGEIIVNLDGKEYKRLKLQTQIVDRELPVVSQWKFHLDLWQNPYTVARYYNVSVWTEKHFEVMRPIMKALAEAGQKVITASIMHKPWNGQTYDYFESMVTWKRTLDGEWTFGFDIFDKWVNFMMSLGIDKQINCYSMVPWNYSFKYFDERTNSMEYIKTKPGDKEYNDMWIAFLTQFSSHLKEKGWFSKTCIAMDERPLPIMKTVLDLIRKADKEFKVALAGLYYEEIEPELYDYCISTDQVLPKNVIEKRKKQHLVTTYYTYCADCKPNTFTFSDPAEAAWIPLYSIKLGLCGYLRWAYNSWGEDPLRDSRFRQWPAGDTYLVYPGFRSSVRFEKMIEGIQQYEKLQKLREDFKRNKHLIRKVEQCINAFNIQDLAKEGTASSDIKRVISLLNEQ